MSKFLSSEWLDQAKAIRAEYEGKAGAPPHQMRMNLVISDVPADVKRSRLNELLALQEGIGLERNRAWIGREVEVLVDSVTPARTHHHDDGDALRGGGQVGGRSREHKLVHLGGGPELVGRLVTARIEHAGPYALRGAIAEA